MKDKLSFLTVFLKRTWIGLVVIGIVAVAGVSSVEIIREEVLNIDPNITYVESDTLYLSCETLDTLNPVLSQSEDVYHLSQLIYDSLFIYDDTLNVTPQLVESYEIFPNVGKVSIKLKEGVLWHNGKELTGKDVQYTVNAMNYAGSRCLYYSKTSKISYVGTRGDYNVDIYFRSLADAALDNLIFPIMPSSQYASAGQLARAEDDFKPTGTGQYKYQSYNYLKQLKLKPFDDYYGEPAEKKLEVMILPDRSLSSNMQEINSVTCYVDETMERKSLVIDKKLTMYDMVSNEVEFLVFNPFREPVMDKNMRHAIATAINEVNILENGYMNDGVLSDTVYYPGFCSIPDSGTWYSYDPEGASEILEKLGYMDRNNDGYMENSSGKDAELTIIVNKNNATRLAAARLIQKNLEDIGFRINLEELTWKEYKQAISARKYDILITGYRIEAQYDLRSFFNGRSEWQYYNYQLSTLANELERLHTEEEYSACFEELKNLMMDELPYYTLCYRKVGLVGVQGFTASRLPVFHDHYRNIDTWNWSYMEEQPDDAELSENPEDKKTDE